VASVDFVDEQHLLVLQVSQNRSQITFLSVTLGPPWTETPRPFRSAMMFAR